MLSTFSKIKNYYFENHVDWFMWIIFIFILNSFTPINVFNIVGVPAKFISNSITKPIAYSLITKEEIANSKELPSYHLDTLQNQCWAKLTPEAKYEFGINYEFDVTVLIVGKDEGFCIANISRQKDFYYQNSLKTLK